MPCDPCRSPTPKGLPNTTGEPGRAPRLVTGAIHEPRLLLRQLVGEGQHIELEPVSLAAMADFR